jgi:hypothetical protein
MRQSFAEIGCRQIKKNKKHDYNQQDRKHYIMLPLEMTGGITIVATRPD